SGDAGRVERALFGASSCEGSGDLEWAATDSAIARACGGTLFVQEVTELPAAVQGRLARVLRDGQFRSDSGSERAAFRFVAGALAWPGNLRELHDVITGAVTSLEAGADVIQIEHLLPALHRLGAPAPFVPAGNLREARLRFEREYIAAVLQHHHWRMADAAETLGIQRPNLYRKARQLGIPIARMPE